MNNKECLIDTISLYMCTQFGFVEFFWVVLAFNFRFLYILFAFSLLFRRLIQVSPGRAVYCCGWITRRDLVYPVAIDCWWLLRKKSCFFSRRINPPFWMSGAKFLVYTRPMGIQPLSGRERAGQGLNLHSCLVLMRKLAIARLFVREREREGQHWRFHSDKQTKDLLF